MGRIPRGPPGWVRTWYGATSEVCAKATIVDGCGLIGKWRACSSSAVVDMKVAEAPVGGLGGPRISK